MILNSKENLKGTEIKLHLPSFSSHVAK